MELTRRSFLTGSALFAAAFIPAIGTASQDQQKKEEKPKDPFNPDGDSKSAHEKTYTDKDGNQYRICPQCGFNMYKEGKMWVCNNCGYSYIE